MAVKLVSADVSVSVQNSATNSLSESSGILYSGEKTYGTLRRTSHPVPAETTHPPPTNTKPPSTIHSSNGCVYDDLIQLLRMQLLQGQPHVASTAVSETV
ncbi:hypothetical protein PF005_g5701 [Phytophthora fragariae]|uniref:Uncharacterized protein n=1 Tax=Phytophthora fragariae TaxID=53985 RepID=A0A6A3SN86_9STRA|nr:hypothetical protein PF003_g30022 [Phytophthora fragariae]KAE8939632.1 hypothetical protein PF009_g10531 [Phytophthora fragariae]KAE9117104.1 hypothetical protein PF007_g9422 [Phytophthora fragariae]KAE9150698.1 hypothetical protein PF006_g4945 [Phytophthora fragariae]KAE9225031.1 hypothetical protein PF005_g5701 [Phytophthora fragariae]